MLSKVSRKAKPIAIVHFNKSAYSLHCKNYKAYWDWVEKRNEDRFDLSTTENKNYDGKNMMHVFRLLNMCLEIATDHKLNVWRNDRTDLLKIRKGFHSYDDLMQKADTILNLIEDAYRQCDLPEFLDEGLLNATVVNIRTDWYGLE